MGLRILEWAAIAFSRDLAYPGIEPASPTSPALAGGFFTTSATCKALILEWVAMSSSRGSPQQRDRTQVSHITGRFFTV